MSLNVMQHICGINWFVERDIDLLLAEELRVNAKFGAWIMSQFSIEKQLMFPAISTDVSVVEDGSEADVIATFSTDGGKHHRLFIENKIDARLMPEQLERYVRRADAEFRRGLITGCSVLFFTPSAYFCASLPAGVLQISFEDAATALRSISADLRSNYRASLLEKALPLRSSFARESKVVAVNPYIKVWWDKVYAMLDREFPGFYRHKTQYPRSVYFAPENSGQAPYLRVDFKGHKGEIDLAFKNIPLEQLESLIADLDVAPGQLVANGKSSAIRISGLERFVISDGIDIIDTKVRASYQAAYELLMYWRKHQELFDALVLQVSVSENLNQ